MSGGHKTELFIKRASEKAPEGAQTTRLASRFCVNWRKPWKKLYDTKGLGGMGAVLFDLPKKGTSKLFVQASVVVRLLLTPEVSPVLTSGGKI